jgi:hypothetical protein
LVAGLDAMVRIGLCLLDFSTESRVSPGSKPN